MSILIQCHSELQFGLMESKNSAKHGEYVSKTIKKRCPFRFVNFLSMNSMPTIPTMH